MTSEESNCQIPPDDAKNPTLWGWPTLLSLVITVAVFVLMASYVDVASLWRHVAASDIRLLFLAALSHYATYPVRGARWRKALKQVDTPCRTGRFGLLVFFYTFVDNVVPAKLGDVYAAHLARINCGIRRSTALGSIVFLRMVDSWVVLFLAASSSWVLFAASFPESVMWALIAAFAVAVIASAVIVFFSLLKHAAPSWLPESIRQRINAFQTGMLPNPGETIRILFLTLVIWALESIWIFLLVRAFKVNVNAQEAIFLTMIPVIATAFPVTPSGAGAVELTLFSCLRLVGIASPLAIALTVVNRFLDYWLHIFLGMIVWLVRGKIGLHTWRTRPARGDSRTTAFASTVKSEKIP